jgi:hypothetical protein
MYTECSIPDSKVIHRRIKHIEFDQIFYIKKYGNCLLEKVFSCLRFIATCPDPDPFFPNGQTGDIDTIFNKFGAKTFIRIIMQGKMIMGKKSEILSKFFLDILNLWRLYAWS